MSSSRPTRCCTINEAGRRQVSGADTIVEHLSRPVQGTSAIGMPGVTAGV